MTATTATTLVSPTPPRAASNAVAFENVSRRFGDTLALDDVALAIASGETVALLGPNGAGKTTAIGIMLGLLEPSSGRARTLGLEPHDAVRSGRVGAMLQSAGLPPGARVGELVDLARGLYPNPSPKAAILDRAGLADLVGRRAETLSGGEAQRVRFAFAIAGDPDLVFLDEPTVAMDVESRRAFWEDMRRFAAEGRTVLFATHYLDEADHVADRILVLDRGRIVGDGSPAALKATVTERTVRFSLADGDPSSDDSLRALPGVVGLDRHGVSMSLLSRDADETVRGLVTAGVAFRHLEVAGADLDTAFLALTSDGARGAADATPARA
jgi:ABC-2 type transport system ATP-binding protein